MIHQMKIKLVKKMWLNIIKMISLMKMKKMLIKINKIIHVLNQNHIINYSYYDIILFFIFFKMIQ